MTGDVRVKVEIVWQFGGGTELTFLEHITLPPKLTQREFLDFCIETVERAKRLGRTEEEKA